MSPFNCKQDIISQQVSEQVFHTNIPYWWRTRTEYDDQLGAGSTRSFTIFSIFFAFEGGGQQQTALWRLSYANQQVGMTAMELSSMNVTMANSIIWSRQYNVY